ncbi:SUMF1/EgtB/PvdO family nonheme iron enzyme [Elongatibacter sediminis]|uniref:SUMF1/EgtB/PvdO family nonheme iron enzyme n=1 Tax=Elongatibacter sediminis TaxID=3119006 RepID=A0AAW9RLW8_9GAMM
MQILVPGTPGRQESLERLPDAAQQERVRQLLWEFADNPGDGELVSRLDAELEDILVQARRALEQGRTGEAGSLLDIVDDIMPKFPGLAGARAQLAQARAVDDLLAAGRGALERGDISQPEGESAWDYYRRALDADPGNAAAAEGLADVEQAMINQALVYARRGEFDAAERVLEEAGHVRPDNSLVARGRAQFDEIRLGEVQRLEARAVRAMDAGEFSTADRILIDLIALGGQDDRVKTLRRRLEEARRYGGFSPGQIIRDPFLNSDAVAPESVVVLAGSFTMGSEASEAGRAENEGPVHRVTFRSGFAIGRTEVTVEQFRVFVKESAYRTDAERNGRSTILDPFSGRLTERKNISWESNFEGRPADSDEPVIHVSWNDAQAYVEWLARGTGKSYRLPSESEFEYALRAGTTTRYWWGNGSPNSVVENLTGDGDSSRSRRQWSVSFEKYSDGFWGPAPVGAFQANPFGLFDMGGNVGEWVRDCWHDTYVRAPGDGSAWINPGCIERVIRGGYWASSPEQSRSAHRLYAKANYHDARIGFRIARDL